MTLEMQKYIVSLEHAFRILKFALKLLENDAESGFFADFTTLRNTF